MMDSVVAAIKACSFRFAHEKELQDGIHLALTAIGHDREVRLGPGDVIDFLCEGGVGIETKVDGSKSAIARQCLRYLRYDSVSGLVLCTTRARHRNMLSPAVDGKRVAIIVLEVAV